MISISVVNFTFTSSYGCEIISSIVSVVVIICFGYEWMTEEQSVNSLYTVFRKKTPIHIFFHISMSDVWI